MHRRLTHLAFFVFLLPGQAGCRARGEAQAPREQQPAPASAPAVEEPPSSPRLLAVGDLHGDWDAAREDLRLAGVLDGEGHWSGGRAVLVQLGDLLDRGPQDRQLLEGLHALQGEAEEAGGRLVVLLGNHEVMNLQGDWRYVTPEGLADFGGAEERRRELGPGGELGRWLRSLPAAEQVGATVFVHGGLRERYARLGLRALNAAVRPALEGSDPLDLLGPEGPFWTRYLWREPEPEACAEALAALRELGARRMVVGHTVRREGRIAARCGGAVLGIDTGISGHYGRHLSVLEIRDDGTPAGDARALYPWGEEDLPDPG